MSKFKIGDRVTVVSRDYFRSGQTGTIVEIEDDSFTNPYFVDFDTPDPDMAQEAIEFYDEDARVAHRHYFELGDIEIAKCQVIHNILKEL